MDARGVAMARRRASDLCPARRFGDDGRAEGNTDDLRA